MSALPDDSTSANSKSQAPKNSATGNTAVWCLLTLCGGAALAWLVGSASPRVRLLGIHPLAMGAFAGWGCFQLLKALQLEMSVFKFGWVILLAFAIHAGGTVQAWRVWRQNLTQEHAAQLGRMNNFLKDADPEFRREAMSENARQFREAISFETYVAQRLDAFSKQIGRQAVWESPVPELILGGEVCLSGIGAMITLLYSIGGGPWSAQPRERSEEGVTA